MRPFRARSSITSTILDDLGASDDLDVATNVATGMGRAQSGGADAEWIIDDCSYACALR
jgi:hypothetical protein